MFLDKIIPKKFLAKQEVCAIEVLFGDGETAYHFTMIKNKGKTVKIPYKGTVSGKLELPVKVIKNKIPVVLIINGKGVILKKISLSQETHQSLDVLLEQNLPTVNKDDLCIQLFRQSDNSAFLSLCRKELILTMLKDLKNKKVDVANVLIGATAIIGLQPLWSNFNCLPTSIHTVELSNGNIDGILNLKQENEVLRLEGVEFERENSLGFAGGLSYLMQNRICENATVELEELSVKHIEKNKFKALTLFCVGIAFVVAVVNVMFYTNYFDKNNRLETELSVYQGKYDQINKLLSDYNGNKDLIESAGILNRNKLSEYADKIGATIPVDVVLSQMYFNPKNETDESEDSLTTFESKHLILKGNCNKSLVVNEWLNVLKMQSFVKEVSLEKFSYSKESVLPNFEIKLITN